MGTCICLSGSRGKDGHSRCSFPAEEEEWEEAGQREAFWKERGARSACGHSIGRKNDEIEEEANQVA